MLFHIIHQECILTLLPKKSPVFSFGRVFSVCKKQINYQYINNEFGFCFDFIRTSIDNINVTIKLSSVERDVLSLIDSKKGIERSVCLKDIHLDNVRIFGQGVQKFVQLNLYTALQIIPQGVSLTMVRDLQQEFYLYSQVRILNIYQQLKRLLLQFELQ